MRLSFKWHTVFEIKSVLLLSAVEIFHGNYPGEFFNTFSTVGDRWKPLSFKMSILTVLSGLDDKRQITAVFAGIVFHA